jgi:hypothetical protein
MKVNNSETLLSTKELNLIEADIKEMEQFVRTRNSHLALLEGEKKITAEKQYAELALRAIDLKAILEKYRAGTLESESGTADKMLLYKSDTDKLKWVESLIAQWEKLNGTLSKQAKDELLFLLKWADELRHKIDNGKINAE